MLAAVAVCPCSRGHGVGSFRLPTLSGSGQKLTGAGGGQPATSRVAGGGGDGVWSGCLASLCGRCSPCFAKQK
jgi:hypothetical protein